MNKAEFYYSDLTPDAQERFLKAHGLSSAAEGNYDLDIIPIFTIEVDETIEDD